MDERLVLIDRETGLHAGWYFWLRVLDEANRSSRYGSPFGLLLLEANCTEGASRRAFSDAAEQVAGAIRSTDLAGLIGAERIGILLVEQDGEGAGAAAERVLRRLEPSLPRGLSWTRRMLNYPKDGGEISQLLTTEGMSRTAQVSLTA